MAKYDGLIIPRSYNDYVNKSDPISVSQALQLTGVMDNVPTAQSTKPAKSGGIFAANAVIMANNKTLSGVAISTGSVVRVLFTAALTGSDATTGLTITYNGTAYAVKVGKDGALEALTAHLIEESYIYLQAYTTLELAFDGSQFVVMGNPVVISNADFSIMADGKIIKEYTIIEHSVGTKLAPNGYSEIDINFILEQGFSIVSYTAQQSGFVDAFLYNLHLHPFGWRLTIYNCASVEQTIPDITIKLLCVKN